MDEAEFDATLTKIEDHIDEMKLAVAIMQDHIERLTRSCSVPPSPRSSG